jgi:DNA recombination protein RmuC
LNIPAWAQSIDMSLVAIIVAILFILLPVVVGFAVWRVYKNRLAMLLLQWQNERYGFENEIALSEQNLLHCRSQQEYTEQSHEKEAQRREKDAQQSNLETRRLQQIVTEQERQLGQLSQQANELYDLKEQYMQANVRYAELQTRLSSLQANFEAQEAAIAQERIGFDEKFQLLSNAEKHLNTQFENVANKIFEQKSEKFTKTSEQGITHLLLPLKQQIDDFKKQIRDQYVTEGQERASLRTEILGLKELNLQITQEAAALTNALKGDNKQQGNWGEIVLARILDESGLREGHEYEIQKHLVANDGKRYRPDVVVHLPNKKDIVIDSKVSLIAHERMVNGQTEDERKRALKEHIISIKGHIKGLSKKDYQDSPGVQTLDYVLMFVPVESAFISAVQEAPDLVKLAMDNQIMLVSPTNLLVALRTINNIWQYEYQNQHAKTIADRAKKMYDKFASFVDDMQRIGKNIDALEKSYDGAMNKLSTGRGNLVTQAESFKTLGVTPTKMIDKELLPRAQHDKPSD